MVNYTEATIIFPEWFTRTKMNLKEEKGRVYNNHIEFSMKLDEENYSVDARIEPFYVPIGLSENEIVKKEIIEPVKELISADIETIKGLLKEIREYIKKENHEDRFFFKRNNNEKSFEVYDYSRFEYGRPSEKILSFKQYVKTPRNMLDEEYKKIFDLTGFTEKEGKGIPFFKGETLKEATERALKAYKLKL